MDVLHFRLSTKIHFSCLKYKLCCGHFGSQLFTSVLYDASTFSTMLFPSSYGMIMFVRNQQRGPYICNTTTPRKNVITAPCCSSDVGCFVQSLVQNTLAVGSICYQALSSLSPTLRLPLLSSDPS